MMRRSADRTVFDQLFDIHFPPAVGHRTGDAADLAPTDTAGARERAAAIREELFGEIMERALAVSVASVTAVEIDAINIRQATLLAMRRAVAATWAGVPNRGQMKSTAWPVMCAEDLDPPTAAFTAGLR